MRPGSGLQPRVVGLEELLGESASIDLTQLMGNVDLARLVMQIFMLESYAYFTRLREQFIRHIIITDKAHLVLASPVLDRLFCVVRKMGLGIWFITQTIRNVSSVALQNAGFSIILAARTPIISEVAQRYMLSGQDKNWLRLNLAPRLAGGALGILYAPLGT